MKKRTFGILILLLYCLFSNLYSMKNNCCFLDWKSLVDTWAYELYGDFSMSFSSRSSSRIPDWAFFYFNHPKKRPCDVYMREYQWSKFFPFYVQDWSSYKPRFFMRGVKNKKQIYQYRLKYDDFESFREKLVFDFCKNENHTFKDLKVFVEKFWNGKSKRFYQAFIQNFDNKKNNFKVSSLLYEIVKGESARYKVHIQIEKKFLIGFIKELIIFLEKKHRNGKNMLYPSMFKVTEIFDVGFPEEKNEFYYLWGNYFHFDGNIPKYPSPIIVLFLPLLPGETKLKNERIRAILSDLIAFYKKFESKQKKDKDIALHITPRFSKQIYKGIYLSGFEGWLKEEYIQLMEKTWFLKKFFTEDGIFIKESVYE